MEFFFYSFSFMIIISTLFSIFSKNLIHSLLYLIVSFLFTSGVFFSLGSFFAAALEVIIYAGAIMVLFIFVIMLLNLKETKENIHKKLYEKFIYYLKIFLFLLILICCSFYVFSYLDTQMIVNSVMNTKLIAIKLFSEYILIIELISVLLLCALVIVFHVGKIKN